MERKRLARSLNRAASASLIGLILLCVAWEMWLAPLHPGGSWLVLKSLPLLAPLSGILHGRRYTHQWASMLSLTYFMEGTVGAATEHGARQMLALGEVALSLVFFAAAVAYARAASGNPGPVNRR